jgi:hypothetical protein
MHSALAVIMGEGENVGKMRRDDGEFFTSSAPVLLPSQSNAHLGP